MTKRKSPSRKTSETANPKPRTESNAAKDPHEWATGDERMTGDQASYLKKLCEEAHEEYKPDLTKVEASLRIDELQSKTGRGVTSPR